MRFPSNFHIFFLRRLIFLFFKRVKGHTIAVRNRSDVKSDEVIFNFLLVDGEIDLRSMTPPELFLDTKTLDAHFRGNPKPLGAVDPRWGSRFSLGTAKRVVRRLARRAAEHTGLSQRLIEKAWFFSVWTELCVLIPTRHLAKHLAYISNDETIFIPISTTNFSVLSYWDRGNLDILYLASALHKQGANVFVVLNATDLPEYFRSSDTLRLEFKPHPLCCVTATGGDADTVSRRAALVPAGMRSIYNVLRQEPDALKIASSFSASITSDVALFNDSTTVSSTAVELSRVENKKFPPECSIFPFRAVSGDLGEWLISFLGMPTKSAAACAAFQVEKYGLTEAHVCDHLFLESQILAHTVLEKGGRVHIWPHSASACHVEMYQPNEAHFIYCCTHAARNIWYKRIPRADYSVISDIMLQPCLAARDLEPLLPLTIVIFGGAHTLLRTPLMDQKRHENSYSDLFKALNDPDMNVRVLFKPKSTWETADWLQKVIGDNLPITITNIPPTEIEEPNLLYITVSFGSTALIEGISRGIPCLIVRDFVVEDYTDIDPEYFEVCNVEKAINIISSMKNPVEYKAMVERQLCWYKKETSFETQR